MDRYSQAVLTVIAAALVAIAAKLWSVPTTGDLMDSAKGSDQDAVLSVVKRVPLLRIQGIQGPVDVTGVIDVNR